MLGGIGGRKEKGRQRMRWLDGITNPMDVSLSELRKMVMDREAWRSVMHGVAKGLPFPAPGDFPDPGVEPRSPTLQADALLSEPPRKH